MHTNQGGTNLTLIDALHNAENRWDLRSER